MKTLRVSLLTVLLLAGATPGSLPVADRSAEPTASTNAAAADGPCYLINGIWVCEG